MRDLYEVVGRDASRDAHDLAANLARKRLLHITLALVILPVGYGHDFEVLEDVYVGVLPDGLHDRDVRGLRLGGRVRGFYSVVPLFLQGLAHSLSCGGMRGGAICRLSLHSSTASGIELFYSNLNLNSLPPSQ